MLKNAASLLEELTASTNIQESLNRAFDKIGFTDQFVQSRRREKLSDRPRKTILVKDLVWGMMEFEPDEVEIIDTPVLQRLRAIRQLGLTSQVYPSAEHSRFSHSLGVAHAARRYLYEIASDRTVRRMKSILRIEHTNGELDVFDFKKDPEAEMLEKVVIHAALLHDCGHFPFSHASEAAIHDKMGWYRIGDKSCQDIVDLFSRHIRGLAQPRIAELMSVIVVLSDRFRNFYRDVVLATGDQKEADRRLLIAALLILGKSHRDDFPGLAQIISSHDVDADKVDYIQRDSMLCNIPVGVDVARLFYRSCFLTVSGSQLESLGKSARGRQTLFVVNASGVDTGEEMIHSRAVLYHRVYRHKTTRLLERIWSKTLEATSIYGSGDFDQDVARLWASNDQSILSMRQMVDGRDSQFFRAVTVRRIPRRVFIINSDIIRFPNSSIDFLDARVGEKLISLDKNVIGAYLAKLQSGEAGLNGELIGYLEHRICEISDRMSLLVLRRKIVDLHIYLVPLDPPPRSIVKTQVSLEKSFVRQRKKENREAQQASARGINKNVGYIFADCEGLDDALSAILTVACQVALAEYLRDAVRDLLPEDLGVDLDEGGRRHEFSRKVTVSPSFFSNPKAVCERIGVDYRKFIEVASKILTSSDWRSHRRILPFKADREPTNMDNLREFEGILGWKVTEASIDHFVGQFPVDLRDEAFGLVESFVVLGHKQTTDSLISFVDGFDHAVIVPMTSSSGHYYCELGKRELRNTFKARGISFGSSLRDSLALLGAGQDLLLFDDNSCTGFQGRAVIYKLAGVPLSEWPEDLKTEFDKLEAVVEISPEFRSRVHFGFISAFDAGINSIREAASRFGFSGKVMRHIDLARGVSDQPFTEGMDTFLREAGRQLITGQSSASSLNSVEDALGSGNLAARFCSKQGATASTISAFWMPGVVDGYPWIPLFIRRGYDGDIRLY